MRVKIENLEAMERFIEQQIFNKAAQKVGQAVVNDLKEFVPNVIWEAFANHDIIKALSSPHTADPAFDIKAHLGLSDSDALAAVQEMESVVKSSISIKRAIATQIGVDISVGKVESNLRSNAAFSYWSHSENGSYHIEWLRWILDGDGAADASIIFVNLPMSRSGRAIMKETEVDVDWFIGDYDFFGGRNFITEALAYPRTKELILGKIRRSFDYHLRKA
jgi:hypothetical protein